MDGGSGDLLAAMTALGLRARAAAADLACADPARKTAALHAAADAAQAAADGAAPEKKKSFWKRLFG